MIPDYLQSRVISITFYDARDTCCRDTSLLIVSSYGQRAGISISKLRGRETSNRQTGHRLTEIASDRSMFTRRALRSDGFGLSKIPWTIPIEGSGDDLVDEDRAESFQEGRRKQKADF